MAMTSPAIPAFQAKPSPTRAAERRWGSRAGRYTARIVAPGENR